MKTINPDRDEDMPVLVEGSNYMVFKTENLDFISNSSSEELLLEDNVVDQNWGWLYSRFSRHKVRWAQSLYLLSYIFQSGCLVLYVAATDFKDPDYANIPFSVDPYFKVITWIAVLALGLPFIMTIYRKNVSSLNLIGRSVKLFYLPVYYLVAILFINRSIPEYKLNLITDDVMVFTSIIFVVIIYYRVKYKDDGRYRVNFVEFLGVQVHFSALLACLLVELCECVFRSIGFYENTDKKDSRLFNWENQNWTILVMTLSFWTGCLILYLYKDIIYPFVLGFTYFGIVSLQTRKLCEEGNKSCSSSVTKAAAALGAILIFFIIITIITYPRLVLYSVRRR